MTIFAAAIAVFCLQACHSNKDSKATADSTNKANDVTSKPANDIATATGMTTDSQDAKFAVEAANGGMAEVMLSRLAQDKGSGKVKDFGAMMVMDHRKANNELMTLAKGKNITLPSVVGADEQKYFNDLSKKSGEDFDKAYIQLMIDDHKNDIKVFDDASKNLKDPDLKAFADKTLPTLKMHLSSIVKIDSALKK
ncbi:outer membrane protein-like protein [Mucilaginibacter paludis DSM 18603]|uniref:Outer membrane protein-like protein n=2 Tax=Mucilaginibacter TaxID=423349 RepID=H1Y4V5_9SPHI|nr:outer membrane protein-like protein [Mucilaginibacter paludis DSM 18603]